MQSSTLSLGWKSFLSADSTIVYVHGMLRDSKSVAWSKGGERVAEMVAEEVGFEWLGEGL